MSTVKQYYLSLKSIIVILIIILTIFLTALFSRQLQSKTPISYQTKAFDFTPHTPGTININIPTIPPINTNIGIKLPSIIIPTLPSIPVVNIQQINLPSISNPAPLNNIEFPKNNLNITLPSNTIPMIGSVVSQGSAIIQQILKSPNAKQIIAMFISTILSPKSNSSTPPSTPPSPKTVPVQPTPTTEPKIILQTCKEDDGTKTNTCPARYNETNKLVYRQCGDAGWCSYTCFFPGTLTIVGCWPGQPTKVYDVDSLYICKDKNSSQQKCPSLYNEGEKEVFRGCGLQKNYIDNIGWCNYTCFKPGTNDVIDCWPGQQKWETSPTGNPQPSGNQPVPTTVVKGKCHTIPGSGAASICGLKEQDITASNTYGECVGCSGITGKGKCTCPDGEKCVCQLLDKIEQTVSCTNGGKWEQIQCK